MRISRACDAHCQDKISTFTVFYGSPYIDECQISQRVGFSEEDGNSFLLLCRWNFWLSFLASQIGKCTLCLLNLHSVEFWSAEAIWKQPDAVLYKIGNTLNHKSQTSDRFFCFSDLFCQLIHHPLNNPFVTPATFTNMTFLVLCSSSLRI